MLSQRENLEEILEAHLDDAEKVEVYKKNIISQEERNKSWSWWAFIFPVMFHLYRKMYMQAAIFFAIIILSSVASELLNLPILALLVQITVIIYSGMNAFKHYIEKLEKDLISTNEDLDKLRHFGGKNKWVIVLVILLPFIVAGIFFFGYIYLLSLNSPNGF